mgnify:CR=1 FL=1
MWKPIGIVCAGLCGLGQRHCLPFYARTHQAWVRIPDDVQVAAFDDSILASVSEPAMTVVKIDVVSLGMAAARMLIQQLRAGEQSPEHLLLPVSIIERGSTKMRE